MRFSGLCYMLRKPMSKELGEQFFDLFQLLLSWFERVDFQQFQLQWGEFWTGLDFHDFYVLDIKGKA